MRVTRSGAGVQPVGDGGADALGPDEAELPLDLWVHDLSIDHRAKPVDHEAKNDDDPARCTEQFGLRIVRHESLVNKVRWHLVRGSAQIRGSRRSQGGSRPSSGIAQVWLS